MNVNINPFQQLYFSDDTQSENNFVELFSDEVLQTAIHPVFQGGNVVLSGTQGCGKTMILSLLRPETRIAYSKSNRDFPVKGKMRNFISAGINLTKSRITDIIQITLDKGNDADRKELPLYFSDFFNYLIISDLLTSVETIGSNNNIFDNIVDLTKTQEFVDLIIKEDCWFGILDAVSNIEELKKVITDRVGLYRRWVNGNITDESQLEIITKSKTNIGEPISKMAECLRQSGMISDDIPVLIRVDQIEELHRAFTERQSSLLLDFRKMINRAFASRDARVHYRAGTRRYGWRNPEYLTIWGSEARLEERRDYLLVDMDEELFSRGEVQNSIFEKFASDTFQKRAEYYFKNEEKISPNLAKNIFGKSPKPAERIQQLSLKSQNKQIDRALALDSSTDKGEWSNEWRIFLRNIFSQDHEGMLNAVLAAAWGRQTGGGINRPQHREFPPPEDAPWKSRKWWRKERLNQTVLQISTRSQQRLMWWGFNDIISLSGGNITVFLHISHRIWDAFLKNQSSLTEDKQTNIFAGEAIDHKIQSAGILFASNEWFNKLPEEPTGNSRQNFAERLGVELNSLMMNDLSMSYPGGNGISLALNEYNFESDEATQLRGFLQDLVDFGVLFSTEHSSKIKSGGRRIKFYLHPILCPRFQLPESRTKEPYYWKYEGITTLIDKANITLSKIRKSNSSRGKTKDKKVQNSEQHSFNFKDI
jgi:hypothetical protein